MESLNMLLGQVQWNLSYLIHDNRTNPNSLGPALVQISESFRLVKY